MCARINTRPDIQNVSLQSIKEETMKIAVALIFVLAFVCYAALAVSATIRCRLVCIYIYILAEQQPVGR